MSPSVPEHAYFQIGRLGQYLGDSRLHGYLDELREDCEPLRDLEEAVRDVAFFRTKSWPDVFALGLFRIVDYVLLRALKPGLAMETGVLHGITTNFMLTALRRNGSGKLISVEYPSYFDSGPANRDGFTDTLPPGKPPGWVVPGKNRGAWDLRLGKSTDLLPAALSGSPRPGYFQHDSEHTYGTMTFELDAAWEALSPAGIVVCDNIDTNSAFADFCARRGAEPLLFPQGTDASDFGKPRFGVVRKP